uniref:Uncharacterized protein n=1 Tax=Anopheles farauti TaxID=69004 RepID=A0A182Q142_9DIPT
MKKVVAVSCARSVVASELRVQRPMLELNRSTRASVASQDMVDMVVSVDSRARLHRPVANRSPKGSLDTADSPARLPTLAHSPSPRVLADSQASVVLADRLPVPVLSRSVDKISQPYSHRGLSINFVSLGAHPTSSSSKKCCCSKTIVTSDYLYAWIVSLFFIVEKKLNCD